MLWKRLDGSIRPAEESGTQLSPGQLHWGPWRIPEPFGTINNIFACIYLLLLWFWSFWPPVTPVVPATMNFSVLVFAFVVVASIVWYLVKGRKVFIGPIDDFDISLIGSQDSPDQQSVDATRSY